MVEPYQIVQNRRDMIAAAVLSGIMAAPFDLRCVIDCKGDKERERVKVAVRYADLLIEELDKTKRAVNQDPLHQYVPAHRRKNG